MMTCKTCDWFEEIVEMKEVIGYNNVVTFIKIGRCNRTGKPDYYAPSEYGSCPLHTELEGDLS